jgi:tripartite-type tricarboxylate transporter receptor subunit TctC
MPSHHQHSLMGFAVAATGVAVADYPEREITDDRAVRRRVGRPISSARIAAQAMSDRLGVPIVVENRGGAGGTVGTQAASTMEADGYTITVATTSTHVVGPLCMRRSSTTRWGTSPTSA